MSLSLDLKVERETQFNTAGGSEFQVRGVAVPNDRLANDVRRNNKLPARKSIGVSSNSQNSPFLP